jgi:Zn ribbon nucleic-acid-binding protein
MPSRRKVYFCRCIHEQNLHKRGFGACRCGCTEFRLRGRGQVVRILECLDPGQTVLHPTRTSPGRPARAPLFRVQCPECDDIYEARAYRRDLVTRRCCRRCADGLRLVGKLTRKKPRVVVGDMPKPAAFADRPHATRLRYLAGCRCGECREANNAYERMRAKLRRAGQGNPMVDATRLRAHLDRLSAKGIGRRTVAEVAGVSETSLSEVRVGKQLRVRAETERRVLAVTADAYSEGHRIDAAKTWKQLDWLMLQGFTKTELARRLGSKGKTPALQVRRRHVNARTAQKVQRLYKEHHR